MTLEGKTLMDKKRRDIDNIFEIFLYLFLILEFITYTVNDSSLFKVLRTATLGCSGVMGFTAYFTRRYINIKIVLFILLMIFSWLSCCLASQPGEYYYNWMSMAYTISYLGVPLGVLSHRHRVVPAAILYYFVSFIVLFRIVILNADIMTFLLSGASYNYIPVLVMLYLMIYLIVLYQNEKNISLIATAVFFCITIVSYGRSSIGAGCVLLILSIYQNYVGTTKEWQKRVLICICMAFLVAGYLILSNYSLVNLLFKKFVDSGLNTSRIFIWTTYLQDCFDSPWHFIFGGDAYLARFDGNLHNSLLQMHAACGIVFFIINIWVLARLGIAFVRGRNIFLFALLLSFLLKANFDRVLFRGYAEIIYYYFVFYYFSEISRSSVVLVYRS